ncbi:MAG: hypothetical protein ABR968_05645 [Bacteroidales bacterium]|jgi:hypothetical protein
MKTIKIILIAIAIVIASLNIGRSQNLNNNSNVGQSTNSSSNTELNQEKIKVMPAITSRTIVEQQKTVAVFKTSVPNIKKTENSKQGSTIMVTPTNSGSEANKTIITQPVISIKEVELDPEN